MTTMFSSNGIRYRNIQIASLSFFPFKYGIFMVFIHKFPLLQISRSQGQMHVPYVIGQGMEQSRFSNSKGCLSMSPCNLVKYNEDVMPTYIQLILLNYVLELKINMTKCILYGSDCYKYDQIYSTLIGYEVISNQPHHVKCIWQCQS